MYNIFHPTDPTAARLEPLLSARFSMLSPVNIPRYAKFPLGNGVPMHLCEYFLTTFLRLEIKEPDQLQKSLEPII